MSPQASAEVAKAARAAAARRVDASDPAALRAVMRLLRGFSRGDARAMAAACAIPFHARGASVASSHGELRRMFRDLLREAGGRQATDLSLMTTMQALHQLGRLPAGASHGEQMLVGRVKLGRVPVTLLLQRQRGQWRVVGLNR